MEKLKRGMTFHCFSSKNFHCFSKTRGCQMTVRKADLEQKEVLSHTMCDVSVELIATVFNGSQNYTFD